MHFSDLLSIHSKLFFGKLYDLTTQPSSAHCVSVLQNTHHSSNVSPILIQTISPDYQTKPSQDMPYPMLSCVLTWLDDV